MRPSLPSPNKGVARPVPGGSERLSIAGEATYTRRSLPNDALGRGGQDPGTFCDACRGDTSRISQARAQLRLRCAAVWRGACYPRSEEGVARCARDTMPEKKTRERVRARHSARAN